MTNHRVIGAGISLLIIAGIVLFFPITGEGFTYTQLNGIKKNITFNPSDAFGADSDVDINQAKFIIYTNQTDGFIKAVDTTTNTIVFNGTNIETIAESAMNALTPNRKHKEEVLIFGNYTLYDTIQIPSYTIFHLVGSLTSADDMNHTMLENSNMTQASGGNTEIEIMGGLLDGNNLGQVLQKTRIHQTNVKVYAMWFNSTENISIHDMTINNGWTSCIRTTFSSNVIVSNMRINNCADDGIAINEQTTFASVTGNIINGTGRTKDFGAPMGIEVQDGAHDVMVVGNVITFSNHSGIQVSSHVNQINTYNVLISGNTISDSQFNGISLSGQSNALISNVTIKNNVIDNVGSNGIDSRHFERSFITDNYI